MEEAVSVPLCRETGEGATASLGAELEGPWAPLCGAHGRIWRDRAHKVALVSLLPIVRFIFHIQNDL